MFIKNIIVFVLVSIVTAKNGCTFRTLYTGIDERFVVYQPLTELFEIKLEKILSEAKQTSPYLIEPARHFKISIREKYINEGYQFDSVEDLEIILKEFNYLKHKNFKEIRLNFDRPKHDKLIERSLKLMK
jgi:hypothetical protein